MSLPHNNPARFIASVIGFALGILVLIFAGSNFLKDLDTLDRYEQLAGEAGTDGDPSMPANQTDGSSGSLLSSLPQEAVAWVTVEGANIDLPVASGAKGFTWYLSHDLWDRESQLGCPFLDPRCPSECATNVIAYGHHVTLTGAMFSPLHNCYRQQYFDRLEDCVWTTRTQTASLLPFCALSVDKDFQDIVRFSFTDQDEFHRWLLDISSVSTAHCPDVHDRVLHAERAVTLVTCSSNLSGQRWRTLVLFVQ